MDESCQIARPYTPITYGANHFDLLVKLYKDGSISQLIHGLKVGETVPMRGPIQTLEYKPAGGDLIMIGGGTGITPLYQMIKSIIKDPSDSSRITLIYGSKTEDDVLLRRELDILEATSRDRLKVFHVIEKGSEKPSSSWVFRTGCIDKNVLDEVFFQVKDRSNAQIFVCGPDNMVKALAGPKPTEFEQGPLNGVLREMGFKGDNVFKL
ncbi:hypothetical protein BC829DRAFT_427269 [Chytridium lagenaria]|nr:hypothetical protein BC829DRAFT_427269 [Chytridium lagenaria]